MHERQYREEKPLPMGLLPGIKAVDQGAKKPPIGRMKTKKVP
jgi:hypothetical protein